jgi:hypothetical protein
MEGVSVTAALDAARLLAGAITRDPDPDPHPCEEEGVARAWWAVFRPEESEKEEPSA